MLVAAARLRTNAVRPRTMHQVMNRNTLLPRGRRARRRHVGLSYKEGSMFG